jgi:ABC-type uncharacterized transport system auxiliary subunit
MKFRFPSRLAIALTAMAVFAGCGPGRNAKTYVLNFPPSLPAPVPAPEIRGALAVHEFQCPHYLCEGRIVYRPNMVEIGFYEFDRWAMNPRDMVTQFVADSIRSGGLFRSVTLQQPGGQPDYVLNGNIERLEEVDHGSDVRAVCTISAQLVDTKSKSIIWSHTTSQTVAVQSRNVAGVVNSLSSAARMTIGDLVKSLDETFPHIATGSLWGLCPTGECSGK